jgi:hypothetical protein
MTIARALFLGQKFGWQGESALIAPNKASES